MIYILTAREDNMGKYYPLKTNVEGGDANVDIVFPGVGGGDIFHVSLSCSQYLLYYNEC